MSKWTTGSGDIVLFEEIVDIILAHRDSNGKISVGTDSFIKKQDCIFSLAICLYGADNQNGGRYFIKRTSIDKRKYPNLLAMPSFLLSWVSNYENEKIPPNIHLICEEHH